MAGKFVLSEKKELQNTWMENFGAVGKKELQNTTWLENVGAVGKKWTELQNMWLENFGTVEKLNVAEKVHLPLRKIFVLHQTK